VPASHVASLIIGVFFVLYGVTVVVLRVRFTRFAKKLESNMYGALGRRVAERFTPGFIATIGCFFIVFGAGGLVSLALGHPLFPV
jgi:hypothetical protein